MHYLHGNITEKYHSLSQALCWYPQNRMGPWHYPSLWYPNKKFHNQEKRSKSRGLCPEKFPTCTNTYKLFWTLPFFTSGLMDHIGDHILAFCYQALSSPSFSFYNCILCLWDNHFAILSPGYFLRETLSVSADPLPYPHTNLLLHIISEWALPTCTLGI